ncbi:hypothetical protein D3C87_2002710 [compost metagenome]
MKASSDKNIISAGNHINSQTTLAGFLITFAHIVTCLTHGFDTGIKRHEMLTVAFNCQ